MSFLEKYYRWQIAVQDYHGAVLMDPDLVRRLALFALDQTQEHPSNIDSSELHQIIQNAKKKEQERVSIVDFANRKMPTFRGVDTNKKISQERIKYGSGVIALAPLLFAKHWDMATDAEKMKMLELASEIDKNKIFALQASGGAGLQSLNLLQQLGNMHPEIQSTLSDLPQKIPTGNQSRPQTAPEKKGVSNLEEQVKRYKKNQQEILNKQTADQEKREKALQQKRRAMSTKKNKDKDDPFGIPSFKKTFLFFTGFSGFIGALWFFVG